MQTQTRTFSLGNDCNSNASRMLNPSLPPPTFIHESTLNLSIHQSINHRTTHRIIFSQIKSLTMMRSFIANTHARSHTHTHTHTQQILTGKSTTDEHSSIACLRALLDYLFPDFAFQCIHFMYHYCSIFFLISPLHFHSPPPHLLNHQNE